MKILAGRTGKRDAAPHIHEELNKLKIMELKNDR
jgi:hypothetical protein